MKTKAVEIAIATFLKGASGLQIWLAEFVVKYFFDKLASPFIKWGVRKGQLIYDEEKGEIVYLTVQEAKERGDKNGYLDSIGDA